MKKHIFQLTLHELQQLLQSIGQPKYRSKQIFEWVYERQVVDPQVMKNLPVTLRKSLSDHLEWHLPQVIQKQQSQDGSTKLLLRNDKGRIFETVILRYDKRTSLCVSSQVGCRLACSFCQTGKLGFVAHLDQSEILSQLIIANQLLFSENKKISHVVFMGMGEPLDNYENAVGAANAMLSEEKFGLSNRHVTLSTSGLIPGIERLTSECKASLAVSLHAATDDLRTDLMPINRKYKLGPLKESLLQYQRQTGRPITLEYILIQDVNCRKQDAKALIKFIHGLRVKVNLIPFNSHPGIPYGTPDTETTRSFQKYLTDRSVPAPVRYSKGGEVSAACGQLAAKRRGQTEDIPSRTSLVEKSGHQSAAH